MSKWKITDAPGFSALINFIKQTRQTSDATASDVSALQEDIQGLAEQTVQTFSQVDEALSGLDDEKLDKTNAASCSIPVSGWADDTTVADFPKYYDLAVADITATDKADILIAPNSVQTAIDCGVCPTCETLAGKIRIRAKQVPSAAISAEYWIEKGKV